MSKVVIHMLRNAAKSHGCPLGEGDTGAVDPSLAQQMVALGIAVEVEQPKPIRGVPEAPKIMAEEAAPLPVETAVITPPVAPIKDRQAKPKT